MVTVSVLLVLHLAGVHSLKEKRAVVRSLVARLRQRLEVSAAEVGDQDLLQRAEVGFAVVSGDLGTARQVADEVQRFADQELLGRAEIIDVRVMESVLASTD